MLANAVADCGQSNTDQRGALTHRVTHRLWRTVSGSKLPWDHWNLPSTTSTEPNVMQAIVTWNSPSAHGPSLTPLPADRWTHTGHTPAQEAWAQAHAISSGSDLGRLRRVGAVARSARSTSPQLLPSEDTMYLSPAAHTAPSPQVS